MTLLVLGAAGLLLGIVIWAGNRLLRSHDGRGAGTPDGLGGLVDVFDPGRARADQDLKSKDHEAEIVPSPGDDNRPVAFDPVAGTAHVRRTLIPRR